VRLAFLVGAIVSLAALVLAFFVRNPASPEITDAELGVEDSAPAEAAETHSGRTH
jgi:hypothetical protein